MVFISFFSLINSVFHILVLCSLLLAPTWKRYSPKTLSMTMEVGHGKTTFVYAGDR